MKDNVRPPLSCALSIEDYSVLFVFLCQIQVYDLLSCTHPDNLYLYTLGSRAKAQGREGDGSSVQRVISVYCHTMSRQTDEEQVVLEYEDDHLYTM